MCYFLNSLKFLIPHENYIFQIMQSTVLIYTRGYYSVKNDMSILSHILQGNLLSEMSRKILSEQF